MADLTLSHARTLPRAYGDSVPAASADPVFNRLLNDRIIFLGKEIDDDIANRVTAQLLMLAADSTDDIYLYINSPGGSVMAGMAVYDTLNYIENDVVTIAMGFCASMGQFLLTSGTRGKRFALPHTRILMHQPSAGLAGSASDIKIYAQQLVQTKREVAELTAQHSGQPVENIIRDSDRDRWFTPEEAREYGLIDAVMSRATGTIGGRMTEPAA
ncbi:ATP-dependent Clp protease proteolytic subunit [Streptomyces armeniacus]|uniref:ATP-dependent Clp protease proteolytic subunit n=1 Tax=Streptomyces armeniacus TaxID=83291 RepID=A0A345XVM3_9ACTN|nr:ATP-dependent Clp protease proteolytic subunit [Streptomyces armeniacus]AXK35689.1 ATP-dependent Clp protease proteolytic subunit [Streptomyces armeniacus]